MKPIRQLVRSTSLTTNLKGGQTLLWSGMYLYRVTNFTRALRPVESKLRYEYARDDIIVQAALTANGTWVLIKYDRALNVTISTSVVASDIMEITQDSLRPLICYIIVTGSVNEAFRLYSFTDTYCDLCTVQPPHAKIASLSDHNLYKVQKFMQSSALDICSNLPEYRITPPCSYRLYIPLTSHTLPNMSPDVMSDALSESTSAKL